MADDTEDNSKIGVTPAGLALGLGVGALLGLALARRAARQSHVEISETVEELKERTQKVLDELSENVSDLLDQQLAQTAPGDHRPGRGGVLTPIASTIARAWKEKQS